MKMTLGKFEGWKVGDLPDDYLEWAIANMSRAPVPLRREMEAELNRRLFGVSSPTDSPPVGVKTRLEPPPRRTPGEALSVGQLSDYLGVPTRTLHRWRKDPSFPRPIFDHGKPRYAKRAVDVWLTTRGLVGAVC